MFRVDSLVKTEQKVRTFVQFCAIMGLKMPFDPSNPGEFREILQKLSKKHKLVSDSAIHLVDLARDAAKAKNKAMVFPPKLSRTTLDRFIKKGTNTRNISGLSELWDVLEKHEIYGYAFKIDQNFLPAGASAEDAMAFALSRYFTEDKNRRKWIDLRDFGPRFIGTYKMYWPARMPGSHPDDLMTSLVEITDGSYALCFSETHLSPETKRSKEYAQIDSGFMFSYASHAHFLVREESKNGTTIRFGSIESIFEQSGDKPIKYFFGKIYGFSEVTAHFLTKFFCTRIESPEKYTSEMVRVSEIEDELIRTYFEKGQIKVSLGKD